MSARAVTLWFFDAPNPRDILHSPDLTTNVARAQTVGSTIFGDRVLVPAVDTTLDVAAAARDSHVYVGHYGSLAVVSCSLFATTKPSTLTRTVSRICPAKATTLLYIDPTEATGVFAHWESGQLRRSFSATPVTIHEDIGLPFVLERPFWSGERPLRYADGVAFEPMTLPFHPAELAEQANREWLGFRFTHPLAPTDLDPACIPVTGFAIHPADYEPGPADTAAYRAATEADRTARADAARARQTSAVPHPTDGETGDHTTGGHTPSGDEPADQDTGDAGDTNRDDSADAPRPRKQRGRVARYFGFGV
ncbi:hypothetical protein QSJ18_13525 [Gordonia sp. ABSL1-1]|uniref:DUF6928 family protein n=1 Tax=Gordonia sp. ABSL1-1 TaxID=3053923 RepID=UPI002573F4C6|nr:hypothetical protein [Gordonia sp. ABSL1-1]MDL9937768.1 hypothetical protein [Gordonia sp. ABSL1-1]